MIQYKTGVSNRAADALSPRDHQEELAIAAVSVCKPVWLEAIRADYQNDPDTRDLMTRLALDPTSEPDFKLAGGILRFKGRVWLAANKETQLQVI